MKKKSRAESIGPEQSADILLEESKQDAEA